MANIHTKSSLPAKRYHNDIDTDNIPQISKSRKLNHSTNSHISNDTDLTNISNISNISNLSNISHISHISQISQDSNDLLTDNNTSSPIDTSILNSPKYLSSNYNYHNNINNSNIPNNSNNSTSSSNQTSNPHPVHTHSPYPSPTNTNTSNTNTNTSNSIPSKEENTNIENYYDNLETNPDYISLTSTLSLLYNQKLKISQRIHQLSLLKKKLLLLKNNSSNNTNNNTYILNNLLNSLNLSNLNNNNNINISDTVIKSPTIDWEKYGFLNNNLVENEIKNLDTFFINNNNSFFKNVLLFDQN
ncbi:uncharacterized protein ASCRUDRAFT_69720 [Ascoidea rubescens DSM 1968]|uniref:Uncharacterized protein n=1 Tax=Ascoidea rubescens DSM 1968 TaxID=1344418 RepID=A0A1D2VK85_9ASCO|nr:hypothetical protein ASCRUDRAFT_69720 [Ascoidea rubescens DSM 1968]ODV62020.1 hypothetical protein ASCRUDRAFT_69720 [Ascoidea rubescens DSM 1968]